nr:hypothetical protein [Flavobacterium sp. ASV13]
MKICSQQHFDNMQMMCQYFESKSKDNDLYLPEFTTSKSINDIIKYEENSTEGIQKILKSLAKIEKMEHHNDVHWLDYKIHIMAVLRENGYKENDVQLKNIELNPYFIKQFNFINNTLNLKVKKSPLIIRIIIFFFAFAFFIFPLIGVILSIANRSGLNIGYFIAVGIFSLLGFYLLRVALWNTYGEETINILENKVIYEANYGWFKDAKKEMIFSDLEYSFKSVGYEEDNEAVLVLSSKEDQVESVVKMSIPQLEELIFILKP